MTQVKFFTMIGLTMFIFVACSTTKTSKISEWTVPDTEFPLAEPGPYYVGVKEYSIVDKSRGGRELNHDLVPSKG